MTAVQNPYIPSIPAREIAARGGRLVDVRKAPARQADPRRDGRAEWIDPFDLGHDHPLMQAKGPITFFCVAGHEVSQFACVLARLHGRDAVFVEGGFAAMMDAGVVQ
ncbi:rhodanese-related sulfurtransferase [Rubricella aquisinus]|uniref:Rhodanese-related sulfurtransferase n=1 Tax=Rubricella aquisinus TaxID=2028108 RepID=A0A840WP58_9RHOB|nr:hypothetical protein [Rubricella aquisinus]MBB5515432.1 rhodanese-related sulfurtransferase [Rubricella aquisinus]